jgi:hypothetical protein
MDDELNEMLGKAGPAVSALARRAIATAIELVPDAMVTLDGQDIGIGTGPGYKGLVFVVTPRADYVTLGVARGAELPDPEGLLEGRGRVHRHVKLRNESDLDTPALRTLMEVAVTRARSG